MKSLVFLGPTLPLETARQHLDAIYLPPVGQGELVTAIQRHRPDAVAIIDGVFRQSLSVWHKEILWALERGVLVFGASSMGALRALETAAYGMIGVGRVHQMYVDGEIEDDDEVAVLHGLPETGHRALTVPMVNLRITFDLALSEGVVDRTEHAALTALAKSICYEERTLAGLIARVREHLPAELSNRIQPFLQRRLVDQKALDAIELLDLMATLKAPVDMPSSAEFVRSRLFDIMYERDRKVAHGGQSLCAAEIVAHAATQVPEFEQLNRAALHRGLSLHLADLVGLSPSEAEIDAEAERFRSEHALARPEQLERWLAENDLDQAEFHALMRDEARCRALRRWLVTTRFKLRGVKMFLDEMRLHGRYGALKRDAAQAERAARGAAQAYDNEAIGKNTLATLIRDQSRSTGMRIGADPSEWLRETGFLSWNDLAVSLLRAKLARERPL